MVNIIKQEIDIEEALKKKLEFVCSFCNAKCEIQKGSIRTIERTKLSYVEPHRIIIKGITRDYDPEVKRKNEKSFKGFNLFNKKEIDKSTKDINHEMEEATEEFYKTNKDKDKEKDNILER